MAAQLQSVAIYLSQNYPPSVFPRLLEKIEPHYPELARLLVEERQQLLMVDCSGQAHNDLRCALPSSFGIGSEAVALRDCYTYPSISSTLLSALEHLYATQQGHEKAFRNTEVALTRIRAWEPLRDYYLRFLRRCPTPSPLQLEARHKALLLATRLAPQPSHALYLLLEWLRHPHPPHPLQWQHILQTFEENQWYEHLQQLLQELERQSLQESQAKLYHQAAQALHSQVVRDKFAAPLEAFTAEELEVQASKQPDWYEARRQLMEAAQQGLSQTERHALVVRCWRALLAENPTEPSSWHYLFDVLIPREEWDILDTILTSPQTQRVPLPCSQPLQSELLQALHKNKLRHTDPLPFYLQALLQRPHDIELFHWTTQVLVEREQWSTLRKIFRIHLTSIDDPLYVQESLADLFTLCSEKQSPKESLTLGLMALSFHPQNRRLLTRLIRYSQTLPTEHALHSILYALAREGKGSQAFQMQCPPPEPPQDSIHTFERILQSHPHHIEAIHKVRQHALQQRDYEKALTLYQKELELQSAPPVRAFLLRSTAELLHHSLERSEEALQFLRQAQQITPHDPDLLLSLCDVYEQIRDYRQLIPTLGQLLTQLPSPSTHPFLLRKIVMVSLDPLHDYHTAMQALSDLLLYHPPITHSLDLIQRIVRYPKARMLLVNLLAEREGDLSPQEAPYLRLEICRALFLDHQTSLAQDRLQQLIESPHTPDPVLEEAEHLAAQHNAWMEMFSAVQRRVQRVEQRPDPTTSLAKLYLRWGDLWRYQEKPEAALPFYHHALVLDPLHPIAFERIRAHLYEQGAYNELRILLNKQAPHIQNHQTAAATYTQLALVEKHLQQHSDAELHLQQAYRLDRQSPRINQLLDEWHVSAI
ncbi:MAG: hypothetical protein EP343_30030 [Deltaproteobacteria bacterium]|nr:MAG: hypothetical protein EP343_30030 [Deltaproteobacteria bacterium]